MRKKISAISAAFLALNATNLQASQTNTVQPDFDTDTLESVEGTATDLLVKGGGPAFGYYKVTSESDCWEKTAWAADVNLTQMKNTQDNLGEFSATCSKNGVPVMQFNCDAKLSGNLLQQITEGYTHFSCGMFRYPSADKN